LNYSQDNNKKRVRQYGSQGRKIQNKVIYTVLRVSVAAVLIAGLALAGAGFGFYMSVISGAPDINELNRGLSGGSFDSVVFDRHGNEIVRLDAGVSRTFAAWDEIPQHLIDAFIAIEDERFWEHNGVDLRGMGRALYQTVLHGNLQGASTITQQLIKNMLGLQRNTIETKLHEQVMAVQFEAMLVAENDGCVVSAKNQILHEYLNIIYLGGGNIGVQAAAQFYFGKDVSELTLSESAVIAAITQFPWRHNPARFPEGNRPRMVATLESMLRLEMITQAEFDYAYNDNVYERIQGFRDQIDPNAHIWSFFVDAVIDRLYEDFMAKGYTETQAYQFIFHGGLQIHTTFDPDIQAILDDAFLNEAHFPTGPLDFEYYLEINLTVRNSNTGALRHTSRTSRHHGVRITSQDNFHVFIDWAIADVLSMDEYVVAERMTYRPQPQSSMVILDHNNGHVMAIAGQRGEKMANRAFCRATVATRQPGSVFKMFAAYAPGFDMGLFTAATTFDDTPNIIWRYRAGNVRYQASWPRNWWGDAFRGHTHVRRAIEQSYNVIAVKAWNAVGAQNAFNYLLNFGFTTLNPAEASMGSIVLGGMDHGVTNLEITAAMGSIANGGYLQPSIFYTVVYNIHGDIIIDNRYLSPTQVLSRDAAYLLIDTMRGVMTPGRGTGWAANLPTAMDNMGKTGTTQNARDVYFVGSTPYFTAGVWVGNDQRRYLSRAVTDQRPDTRLWRYVMEQVHYDLEIRRFERPLGFTTHQVCADSGGLPTWACFNDPRGSRVRTELFAPGTIPVVSCHIHTHFYVEYATGLQPSPWTPADQIVRRSFIIRDRSFEEISGPVSIADAWVEVPWATSTLFNPYVESDIYDYYDPYYEPHVYDDYQLYELPPDDFFYEEPPYQYIPQHTTQPPFYFPTTPPPTEAPTEPPTEPPPPTLPFTIPQSDRPPITWPEP